MKTTSAAHRGALRLMTGGGLLAQGIAAVLATVGAAPQVIPATAATNAATIITSAGFTLTSEGFISFTNATSAMNHDKELEVWNLEGATLSSEAVRELESRWAANPKDEPSLVRLLSYRLVHYESYSQETPSNDERRPVVHQTLAHYWTSP